MWEVKDKATGLLIRYDYTDSDEYTLDDYEVTLIGGPCDEWREELYRRALDAQVTNSVYDSYYDSELIAEWRSLYDPTNKNWGSDHWNSSVANNPGEINYWLDFIDTSSALGKYSVNEIGRRTKVVNSDDIKTVYNKEVPDIMFIKNGE
jgi:hypothetical protein